jgi:replicative DNA helicase
MGSIMDDEDEITDIVVENTLNNLVREVLYSEQWKTYLQSLMYSTMFREIQSLNDRINRLESDAINLEHAINTSGYILDKMYDADGKIQDVILIKKQSDY